MNPRFLFAVLGGVCTVFMGGLVPPALANVDDAVALQINPAHTGLNNTPGVTPALRQVWATDLGAPVSYALIAGGLVYMTAGDSSTPQVNLYALNASTGQVAWGPVALPKGIYSWANAAYENGKLFVVTDSTPSLSNGLMNAYDAATGSLLWTAILPGQYLFDSAPTALNGLVYTAGAGSGGTVYAVRESDGSLAWIGSVENGNSSSPAVTADGVYVSYACPQSYKFDPGTGALLWHYSGPCEGGGGAAPVVNNGSVYVRDIFGDYYGTSGQYYSGLILNSASGLVSGYFDPGYSDAPRPPAFDNNLGFFVQNEGITAQDQNTGATVWSHLNGTDAIDTAPIVVNGIVYVGTQAGNLIGYNENTGVQAVALNVGTTVNASGDGGYGQPTSGLSAGDGLLLVPAGTRLVALTGSVSLQSLSLQQSLIVGGQSTTGTVTLSGPAPSGGISVQFASSNPAALVPAVVPVPAGATSATFTITSDRVKTTQTGSITASLNGGSLSTAITVEPKARGRRSKT